MKPKKYCEYCKYLGQYPNGKKRCERETHVQPFVEREQEACDKFFAERLIKGVQNEAMDELADLIVNKNMIISKA